MNSKINTNAALPSRLPTVPQSPRELAAWIRAGELRLPSLKPGTEKLIVFTEPEAPVRTPIALAYIHGFSSSRQEMAPLSDRVGMALGANVFNTRLTGHGLAPAALGEATLAEWLGDVAEALAVASALGEKTAVLATSTGATLLLALLAARPEWQPEALILVSPNFAPCKFLANIAYLPGARWWAPLLLGRMWHWQPCNAEHARYWTCPYPQAANFTMMEAVRLANRAPLARITAPTLCYYSPEDCIVKATAIVRKSSQLGSPVKQLRPVDNPGDPRNHILAGDILAPGNTGWMTREIAAFVGQVLR